VSSLPDSLPPEPVVNWQVPLVRSGLGGIAATDRYVVLGDRDGLDYYDVWRCFEASSGKPLWEVKTLAIGALDYGNSPRTTPLLARKRVDGRVVPDSGRAFLLGAFGDLLCVDLATGTTVWQKNLHTEFSPGDERPWGYCGSPLLIDNRLIVNPGAAEASLVAFDPETGEVLWKAPGRNVGYGSFTAATLGGRCQIVGHDATTLGGWDVQNGARLWTLTPPIEGDFNVPTPLAVNGRLLVATENNGVRLYAFDGDGRIKNQPVAQHQKLKPDMSTPVVAGQRLFCVDDFLYCLDLSQRLREVSRLRDAALGDYAALFSDGKRVLIVGSGELLLVHAAQPTRIVSRWRAFRQDVEIYSHAAIDGGRLYVRGENELKCITLE
jgi:outer membrane protein assembly factor BamB